MKVARHKRAWSRETSPMAMQKAAVGERGGIRAGIGYVVGLRMKRDPVCNLLVDEKVASTLKREGKTFYFCGEECKRKFIEEGEQKVSPGAKPSHSTL